MSAKYRYLNCGLIISVLFLVFAPNAAAESAKEQLQGTIDRVIEVLRTIHSAEDIERNRNSLRQILLTRFDFAAMAEKSLGNHWKDLDGRKEEFVSAFTDFVEHSYMSTLGSYRGEKVVYDRDRVDGESAEVDDAVIDDVSVVGNYRSQFARILHTGSLEKLIQNLRAKASGH